MSSFASRQGNFELNDNIDEVCLVKRNFETEIPIDLTLLSTNNFLLWLSKKTYRMADCRIKNTWMKLFSLQKEPKNNAGILVVDMKVSIDVYIGVWLKLLAIVSMFSFYSDRKLRFLFEVSRNCNQIYSNQRFRIWIAK